MGTSKWGNGGDWEQHSAEYDQIVRDGMMYHGEVVTLTKTSDGMMLPDFTERVNAGMDLLDKVNPGWQDELDFSSLNLEDDQQCVLGQSWPLYAKAHGIIERVENGDYKEFADEVFALADRDDDFTRNQFAASIGCALKDSDFFLINGEAMEHTAKKHNYTREDFLQNGSLKVEANQRASLAFRRCWEELTATWIAQIIKAKVDGRWGPRTVADLDASIAKTKEKEDSFS